MSTGSFKTQNGNGPWYAGLVRRIVEQGIGAVIAILVLVGVYFLTKDYLAKLVENFSRTADAIEVVAEETKENGKLLAEITRFNQARTDSTKRLERSTEQSLRILVTPPAQRSSVRREILRELEEDQ